MAELTDASIPVSRPAAAGAGRSRRQSCFFPKARSRSKGTGRAILELCAGQLTLAQIVQKLEQQFILAPPGKIRADVISFVEQLHAKRIIDY